MSQGFDASTSEQSGYRVVSLRGEFDLLVKPEVDAELRPALEPSVGPLIIDLEGLTFIDSSGVHSLVMAHRSASANGQRLVVVPGSDQVTKVLRLCGLESRLAMADSVADAIARLQDPDFAAA
jgi:anti-anti-sigma factor